jgi:hypothetical protein
MRQSVPLPWELAWEAPFGIANFIHSTKAKYFYKDVVWESVDCRRGSGQRLLSQLFYQYGKNDGNIHTCVNSLIGLT